MTEQRRVPGFLSFLEPPPADSPFPSIGRALRRGFGAVISSVPLLATAFAVVFLQWVALVALGLDGPFGRLVHLLAIPPISTYFDTLNGSTMFGYGGVGFAVTLGLVLVRAAVTSVMAGLVVAGLEGRATATGFRDGVRAFPATLAACLLGLGLMIVGSVILPLLGPGVGFLGSVLLLVLALFLFAYVPFVAIAERLPLAEVVRTSIRAARMPGSRHLVFSMAYLFLCLPLLVALMPSGARYGVNPPLDTWAFALLAAVLHLGFLAAFGMRYLAVRDVVPAAVPRQPRARGGRRNAR
ncbi:MAG: hypothetical protein ACKOI0_06630 [Actinomycetota bacterium]